MAPRQRTGYQARLDPGRQVRFNLDPNIPQNSQGQQYNIRPTRPPHAYEIYDADERIHLNDSYSSPPFDQFNNQYDIPIVNGAPLRGRREPNVNPAFHEGINPIGVPNQDAPYPSSHGADPSVRQPGPGLCQHQDNEMNRLRSELEEAKEKDAQREQQNTDLRLQLALNYEQARNFGEAGRYYHDLFKSKALQETALREAGHGTQAITVEEEELLYEFKYGKMLNNTEKHDNFDKAATALKDVFRRRSHNDPHVRNESTRDAMLELGKALRLGGTQEGLEQARKLYRAQGDLDCRGLEETIDWRLLNAFKAVPVLVEQGSCDNAVKELSSVWRKRQDASDKCIAEIESEMVDLFESFKRQNREDCGIKALRIVCQSDRALSDPLVRLMMEEGLRFYDSDRYAEAIDLLQTALASISLIAPPPQEQLKIGWALAFSYCHMKHHKAAAPVLENILPLSDAQTEPSEYCLKALLGSVQLTGNQPTPARKNAQDVWDKHKTQNILPFPNYHQADTLIRAIAQDKYEEGKWKKARDIWNEVYKNAKRLCSEPNAADQVECHIATGEELAERWRSCWNSRSNNNKNKGKPTAKKRGSHQLIRNNKGKEKPNAPEGIDAIRKQVRDLQRLLAG